MSFERTLFFDGCNLNTNIADSVNNYSKIPTAKAVHNKGEIIKSLMGGRKYQLITIAGHGAKNEISVGSGMEPTTDPTKEVTLKKFEQSKLFFKKYLPKFLDKEHSTPIVFLAGCEIFDCLQSSDKASLVKKISSVMKDVLVIAPSTLIKPELKTNKLNIKFEVKPGKEADFDFDLTLAAYKDGERVEDMATILALTKCQSQEELQNYLCKWSTRV